MTKRERLEDLGRLSFMLDELRNQPIFNWTSSKHEYEKWKEINHDTIEFGEPKGVCNIFHNIRGIKNMIDECFYLADGEPNE